MSSVRDTKSYLSKRKAEDRDVINLVDDEPIDLVAETERDEKMKKQREAAADRLLLENTCRPIVDSLYRRIVAAIGDGSNFATMSNHELENAERHRLTNHPDVQQLFGACMPTGFVSSLGISDPGERKAIRDELHSLPSMYQYILMKEVAQAFDRNAYIVANDLVHKHNKAPKQGVEDLLVRLNSLPNDDPNLYYIQLTDPKNYEAHLVVYDPSEKLVYDSNYDDKPSVLKGKPTPYTLQQFFMYLKKTGYTVAHVAGLLEKQKNVAKVDKPINNQYYGYGRRVIRYR